jgi:mycothiol synthase
VTTELRAPTLDDVPALAEFFAGLTGNYGVRLRTEAEVRDDLRRVREKVGENYRIAFDGDGIAGYVELWSPEEPHDRVFLAPRTLPRERRLYGLLLDWAERRASEMAHRARAQVPVEADDGELRAELEKRGYELVRWFFEMEIDLTEEPPQPAWPDGIAVRTFEPGDARAVYEADLEAFEDHWEPVHVGFDEWCDYFLSSWNFDPSLWFLAEEDGELAGVSMCARRGGETGYVSVLAVRRPWRRRGLGTALLLHSFRELRRHGCPQAALSVDGDNMTGAVRMYERAGMHVARRAAMYWKDLG